MSELTTGRYFELSNGGFVFVGNLEKDGLPDGTAIAFRNSDGDITKLAVSPIAASALKQLLVEPDSGTPSTGIPDFLKEPVRYEWKAVVKPGPKQA